MSVVQSDILDPRFVHLRGNRRRRGSVILWSIVALAVIGGIAGLTYDMSRMRTAKSELQAAADAAALNGANGLVDGTFVSKAQAAAIENACVGVSVQLAPEDIRGGHWSGVAFTTGGSPRNAIYVTARRTTATGNPVQLAIGELFGLSSFNIEATAIASLINRSGYEWAAVSSFAVSNPVPDTLIAAYDASNPGAGQTQTAVKSDGSVSFTGNGIVNAKVNYVDTVSRDGVTITGTVAQQSTYSTYPPGSQVANLNGSTWTATTSMNFTSSATVPGGTYVLKDFVASNCNVTFSGPTTIILQGNLSVSNSIVNTAGSLPKNLKIIATKPGSLIAINDPRAPFVADFYAPGSNFTLNSGTGYHGLRGRGVFKTFAANGAGATLLYDRSMDASIESRVPILVR